MKHVCMCLCEGPAPGAAARGRIAPSVSAELGFAFVRVVHLGGGPSRMLRSSGRHRVRSQGALFPGAPPSTSRPRVCSVHPAGVWGEGSRPSCSPHHLLLAALPSPCLSVPTCLRKGPGDNTCLSGCREDECTEPEPGLLVSTESLSSSRPLLLLPRLLLLLGREHGCLRGWQSGERGLLGAPARQGGRLWLRRPQTSTPGSS